MAANVYYAQPLVGPITASLGMAPWAAGLIVTATQLGYGAGLLLLVPLSDLVENRRLTLTSLGVLSLALVAAGSSAQPATFLGAAAMVGVGSTGVQILVLYAAHLSSDAERGRSVGNVMSGLMIGVMLARPAASLVAEAGSWRAVFYGSAAITAVLAVVLRLRLPPRRPLPGVGYLDLLASMGRLFRDTPVLRRRAFYQACLFCAVSLFWTTVPLLLADTFRFSQAGIACFALAGAAGAVTAPLAGRVADRGGSRPATSLAIVAVGAALVLAQLGLSGPRLGLAALVAAAILIDVGATVSVVLGQRAIFSLGAEVRGRLNGLYIAIFFVGGAVGSALGSWAYAVGGWSWTIGAGSALPALALAFHLGEPRS